MIIRHCSPTLAGIKTGNMFSHPYGSIKEMRSDIRCLNKTLSAKGVCVIPLRYNGKSALIYIYRPSMLSKDLQNKTAYNILSKCGYGICSQAGCVAQLMKRMAACKEFPHEVGLFLGYPPDDVKGFIENNRGGCKCVGYWKVYGDVKSAVKTFGKYKKCTQVYAEQYAEGKTVERLTVSSPTV